jgi:hypothetical protein
MRRLCQQQGARINIPLNFFDFATQHPLFGALNMTRPVEARRYVPWWESSAVGQCLVAGEPR